MGSMLDLNMIQSAPIWPYVPTPSPLALALGLGMLIGIERERRRKEAALRTFAVAAPLGARSSPARCPAR